MADHEKSVLSGMVAWSTLLTPIMLILIVFALPYLLDGLGAVFQFMRDAAAFLKG